MKLFAAPASRESSAARSVARICRRCGAKVFRGAPEGLCTCCLLEAAILAPNESPDFALEEDCALLREFGNYQLLEEIGRGGQGVVFRARQMDLNRLVALKVIGPGQWATAAHLRRFRREAEAAARLNHPGVVPIYEVGEHGGSCYFSMKLIEGGPLDEFVRRKPLAIRPAVTLVAKIARILQHAHEHGILHRDVKPKNVLLDAAGEPRLTDFGLARLMETESTVTRTLEVMGTPSYMAPEQAAGRNAAIGPATDIYGIGAVLYQLLTGHPPFAGGTTYETIRLLLETEPRNPRLWNRRIDRDLSTICLKCLEKDPARRYSSAGALADDLEHWLQHEPIAARRSGFVRRSGKWTRRNPTLAVLALALVALVAMSGWEIWKAARPEAPITTGIAVLPFENLSAEKENAALVDGLQEVIVGKLARIGGLKVISPSSVMAFHGEENVHDIGETLRVSHLLTGGARRSGQRIQLDVQLVDARTAATIWSERYERDLHDFFALESEVALTIAGRLHVQLSRAEEIAIARQPASDLFSYELYARAYQIQHGANSELPNRLKAIDLLNQAVTYNSGFLQAWCELALAHDILYSDGADPTPARLASARAAVERAFQARPDAGEAHLAQAIHLYRGYRDYDGALAELEVAARTLPNDARVFSLMGYIQRRNGRSGEAGANMTRAAELDPRDSDLLEAISYHHQQFGRWLEAKQWHERAIAAAPADDLLLKRFGKASWELSTNANPQPMHAAFASFHPGSRGDEENLAGLRLLCALYERDAVAARKALNWSDGAGFEQIPLPKAFVEGLIARMEHDEVKALQAFTAARDIEEKLMQTQPRLAPAWCALGLIDAGLGKKEESLREGRRALEITPMEKDAVLGKIMVKYFAVIAAWVGEKDLACAQLRLASTPPRSASYVDLKLSPIWDPLRGEPSLKRIIDSLSPPPGL
jgi:TolB-like protein